MAKMSKVARASVILMIGTILSKGLGFARELMVAYRFGAGSISDAFVLTNSIPTLIFVSVATAININFIPYYHRIDVEDDRNRFTSNLTNISIIILFIGCLVINIFPRQVLKIFATGLPEETERYAILMLRIVVFSIIPIILSHLYQAYLQANESFASTAVYGIITNIAVILFTYIATDEKYYVLSVGTIVSHAVGLIPIFYSIKKKTSFHYCPYIDFRDQRIKDLVLLTLPLMVEDLASSMSLLVDRNLASFLDKGTISGLGYAGTIGNIASTMIASAIMTATFPLFSKMLANGEKAQFEKQFEKYASIISYLLGPISVFMVLNAGDIVTFIFEHGAFNSTATRIVSESMICYSLGVLPMGLQSYLIRGFYAMQDTKTPVKIKVLALICNIVLNLLSVRWLKHMGIALSTSISYVIAYGLLTYNIKKKHGIQNIWRLAIEGGLSLLISLIPAVTIFIIFNNILTLRNLFLKLFFEGVLFVIGYIMMIMLFRKDRFNEVIKVLKR